MKMDRLLGSGGSRLSDPFLKGGDRMNPKDLEHEVINIGGIEVWRGYEDFGIYLNEICLELGQGRYKISESVVCKLPKGWALFLGAGEDPQEFGYAHAYIPENITFSQLEKLVPILEKKIKQELE